MNEIYFSGFEFKKLERAKPVEFLLIPTKITIPDTPIETVTIGEGEWLDFPVVVDIDEPVIKPWKARELKRDFVETLSQIDRLNMRRRTMTFVSRDKMAPKTEAERQELVKRYGNYMTDGGAGDCLRYPDGTFALRIGYKGQEKTVSSEDVLSVMGHEYGHTLGKRLDDPILEELKAYTFANLFMRYYHNVDEYLTFHVIDEEATVHDTALYWLEQLMEEDIKEEAILAHLIGKRFGNFSPADWAN